MKVEIAARCTLHESLEALERDLKAGTEGEEEQAAADGTDGTREGEGSEGPQSVGGSFRMMDDDDDDTHVPTPDSCLPLTAFKTCFPTLSTASLPQFRSSRLSSLLSALSPTAATCPSTPLELDPEQTLAALHNATSTEIAHLRTTTTRLLDHLRTRLARHQTERADLQGAIERLQQQLVDAQKVSLHDALAAEMTRITDTFRAQVLGSV